MKLEYTIFYSSDLKRASHFYESTLGLTKELGNESFTSFKIGDRLLGIKLATDEREKLGSQTMIVSVDDLDAWNEKIKKAEVTFYKEISDDDWGRNFAILDPDSNKVEFVAK